MRYNQSIMNNNMFFREKYEKQLLSLSKEKGIRNTLKRRMTARSQLRAAIALSFLYSTSMTSNTLLNHSNHLNILNLLNNNQLTIKYLYYLSEIQEIRLSCMEETLLHSFNDNNVLSLIKTWLQDESYSYEVVELCRDMLLIQHTHSNTHNNSYNETQKDTLKDIQRDTRTDTSNGRNQQLIVTTTDNIIEIWKLILLIMNNNNMYRSYFITIHLLMKYYYCFYFDLILIININEVLLNGLQITYTKLKEVCNVM